MVMAGIAAGPPPATPGAVAAARQAAVAHAVAAQVARARARAAAARAALLAEREVVAAAGLRGLEAETGAAAARLAGLLGQAAAARRVLAADEATLARLLPMMLRLAAQPAATLLAIPESPADAVRGVLVVQGVAAEIGRRSAAVRAQAAVVAGLLRAARAQQAVLTQAVARQEVAELALTGQVAAARAAELADADAAVAQAAAAAKADRRVVDLQAMLRRLALAREVLAPLPARQGAPVAGLIVQGFGDPTLAGPAEGVSYRAAPGARVTAPCAGPVLFADRFQGYGLLVILDCGGGVDFVLSGMASLDVAAGQRVAHGQPVGEMQGFDAGQPTRQPLLYVELRRNGAAVDPSAWLAPAP